MKQRAYIKLPNILSVYKNADYTTKQKVSFIFYLTISAIVGVLFLSISSSLVQLKTQEYGKVQLQVLIPMLIALVLFVICLLILIKGRYKIAAQFFISVASVCVWFVMWIESGNAIVKINTVVIVVAILSLFPLYVANSKKTILIFTLLNVITLIVFAVSNRSSLNISDAVLFDYVADTGIAFIFTGVVGYFIFKIHSASIKMVKDDFDERIKVEKDLRESEMKFRNIFESAQIGIYQTKPNGEILKANPALIAMLGYESLEELKERNLEEDDVYIDEGREKFKDLIQKEGAVKNYESKWLTKTGEEIIVKENCRLVKNDSGEILFYEGFVENVTERRLAEQKLRENKQLFQILAEVSPVGVFRTRPDGYTTYVNPKWTELSGMTFEQAQGDEWLEAVHPDDRTMLMENWKNRSAKGEQSVAEYRFVKANGEITWVLGSAVPEIIDGNIKGYVGTITDITALKLTARKLKESEEKYRTLMESMNEVIMMVDNDDKVQYVNKKFTEILGYTEEEIIGEIGYEKLIDPKEHKKIIDANQARTQNIISQYESSFIAKDGTKVDFLISGAPIKDSNGKVIGSIGSMMDITEKKKIEKELAKYRQHLEFLVKERTEELAATNEELMSTNEELHCQREELETTLKNLKNTQQQLIHAEKMASLGVLASGIAHEINNPLNFIRGGAFAIEQYLEDEFKDKLKEISPLLEGINEGVERASDIVSSLKHYSHSNPVKLGTCNINSIIENCLTMLRNKIDGRITIIRDLDNSIDDFKCNEGKLHQAILNILLNAVQAIEGTGSIKINTLYNNLTIIILISDTGVGISKENLTKVLDPFFTTKEAGKGTGLGLSITYNILEEIGGSISINSKIGKGTDVEIKIPFKTQLNES